MSHAPLMDQNSKLVHAQNSFERGASSNNILKRERDLKHQIAMTFEETLGALSSNCEGVCIFYGKLPTIYLPRIIGYLMI